MWSLVIGAVEMYSTWTLLDVSKYSVCYGFYHCSEFILQIFILSTVGNVFGSEIDV